MKHTKRVLSLILVAVLVISLFSFVACNNNSKDDESAKVVRISTTTSVNDSGLMAYLQPYFKKDTGYDWEIASAGTGAAINAAKYGNADVILVHSKSSEEEFVNAGYSRKVDGYAADRISFMYNFFVLVGPTADKTVDDLKGNPSASVKDGFSAIASAEKKFISRGDKSGTHNKEWTLWPESVGLTDNDVTKIPEGIKSWYISAGQGMGACLTMANDQNAYCLTDKATFLSFKNNKDGDKLPNLEIKWEEDNSMKNTYSMIAVKKDAPFVDANGNALPSGSVSIDTVAADIFINWMTSEHAKALISFYGISEYGGSLFTLMDGYLAK